MKLIFFTAAHIALRLGLWLQHRWYHTSTLVTAEQRSPSTGVSFPIASCSSYPHSAQACSQQAGGGQQAGRGCSQDSCPQLTKGVSHMGSCSAIEAGGEKEGCSGLWCLPLSRKHLPDDRK